MIWSSLGPFAAVALFGWSAPTLARRMRPSLAVPLLSAGALLLALASLVALAVSATAGLGRVPAVAYRVHWSPVEMRIGNPFSPALGTAAALLLLAAAGRTCFVAMTRGRHLLAAWSAARRLETGLVVTEDRELVAFVLPGWPGRIVVSRSMLRSLDGPGRRALLAHEQAHLRGRDDLHLFAAQLAAGLNPFVRQVPSAVRAACERRADESAAADVGDRRIVARALATAMRPHLGYDVAGAFHAAGGDMADRLNELLKPRRRSLVATLVPLLLLALSAVCLLWLGHDLDNVTDAAGMARAR